MFRGILTSEQLTANINSASSAISEVNHPLYVSRTTFLLVRTVIAVRASVTAQGSGYTLSVLTLELPLRAIPKILIWK